MLLKASLGILQCVYSNRKVAMCSQQVLQANGIAWETRTVHSGISLPDPLTLPVWEEMLAGVARGSRCVGSRRGRVKDTPLSLETYSCQ